jgi:hypothetical protein
MPQRVRTDSVGNYCREYQSTVGVGGKTEQADGTACRLADGSWKVVNDRARLHRARRHHFLERIAMFEVITPTHPRRKAVEATIRLAYQCDHGARLTSFPAWLVANIDETGVIGAAALRFAADGFFSELYLDKPIEQTIARWAGGAVDRAQLVEVGNLAAGRSGEIKVLIQGIIALLYSQDTRWAFFTATARLRNLLRRAGIPLIELASADPRRIDDAASWGSYYQEDPRVVLVGQHMLVASLQPISAAAERRRHA